MPFLSWAYLAGCGVDGSNPMIGNQPDMLMEPSPDLGPELCGQAACPTYATCDYSSGTPTCVCAREDVLQNGRCVSRICASMQPGALEIKKDIKLADGGASQAAVIYDSATGTIFVIGGAAKDVKGNVTSLDTVQRLELRKPGPLAFVTDQVKLDRTIVAGSAAIFNGTIYVFGGTKSLSDGTGVPDVSMMKNGQWVAGPSMPSGHAINPAIVLTNKGVVVAGGHNAGGDTSAVHIFDGTTWKLHSNLPQALVGGVLYTRVENGRETLYFMYGSNTSSGKTVYNSAVYLFNESLMPPKWVKFGDAPDVAGWAHKGSRDDSGSVWTTCSYNLCVIRSPEGVVDQGADIIGIVPFNMNDGETLTDNRGFGAASVVALHNCVATITSGYEGSNPLPRSVGAYNPK